MVKKFLNAEVIIITNNSGALPEFTPPRFVPVINYTWNLFIRLETIFHMTTHIYFPFKITKKIFPLEFRHLLKKIPIYFSIWVQHYLYQLLIRHTHNEFMGNDGLHMPLIILLLLFTSFTEALAQWRLNQRQHSLTTLNGNELRRLANLTDVRSIRTLLKPILVERQVGTPQHDAVANVSFILIQMIENCISI